jgi:hypothetical protein
MGHAQIRNWVVAVKGFIFIQKNVCIIRIQIKGGVFYEPNNGASAFQFHSGRYDRVDYSVMWKISKQTKVLVWISINLWVDQSCSGDEISLDYFQKERIVHILPYFSCIS